jgi:hypothetical protein
MSKKRPSQKPAKLLNASHHPERPTPETFEISNNERELSPSNTLIVLKRIFCDRGGDQDTKDVLAESRDWS